MTDRIDFVVIGTGPTGMAGLRFPCCRAIRIPSATVTMQAWRLGMPSISARQSWQMPIRQ